MKKALYTILSICSIFYIACLAIQVVRTGSNWNPDFGNFEKFFMLIINFGGVAIIFAFALVNFAGSPLKTIFFILLILAIVLYIIVMCIPDSIYGLFGGKKDTAESAMIFLDMIK